MWEKFEELRKKKGVSAYQVCKEIGEPTGMISNWKAGRYQPKSDKIQKIADYFGVPVSYFYEDSEPQYYLNPETAKVAQEIFDDRNLRALFDAARDSKPEDLKMAAEMLRKFKATNPDG